MPVLYHVQLHIFCSALASLPPILLFSVAYLNCQLRGKERIPYLSGQHDRSCSPSGFVISVIYKLQTLVQSVMLVELQWK